MDSFFIHEMNGTKMSALDVLTIMVQNGWNEAVPAWTSCRELFYDATFTEYVRSYFERACYETEKGCEDAETAFDKGTCCDFADENAAALFSNSLDWCTCVETAQFWRQAFYTWNAAFNRLLDTREELLTS